MPNFIADNTERLDKFLAQATNESRSKVQKAIKNGLVLINGKAVVETDYHLKLNDEISLPEFEGDDLKPFDFDLKVVFENNDLAVIDKPAGLVVHPGAGNKEGTLANALINKYPEIEKVGDPHRPGIVHRLDEDTSGLILVAKNQDSFEYYKNLFLERKVEKEYIALVHGIPGKLHDVIDLPLEKVPLKQKMKVGSGKPAVTEYSVLQTGQNSGLDQTALLKVKLHTGRTHQIRAHLSHIGHPIVGDKIYGKGYNDSDLINRQFLHARLLKFQLSDGSVLELKSELPDDLKQALSKVNISYDDSKF